MCLRTASATWAECCTAWPSSCFDIALQQAGLDLADGIGVQVQGESHTHHRPTKCSTRRRRRWGSVLPRVRRLQDLPCLSCYGNRLCTQIKPAVPTCCCQVGASDGCPHVLAAVSCGARQHQHIPAGERTVYRIHSLALNMHPYRHRCTCRGGDPASSRPVRSLPRFSSSLRTGCWQAHACASPLTESKAGGNCLIEFA